MYIQHHYKLSTPLCPETRLLGNIIIHSEADCAKKLNQFNANKIWKKFKIHLNIVFQYTAIKNVVWLLLLL